jgi:hypothetical protein
MIKTFESPLKKYHSLGILKAGELLLQPTDAILAINDMEQLGILILGVDLWYNQGSDLAEDPNSLDLSDVDDVSQNADSAREFITHHLPKRTTWVSLVYFEESTPATKTKLLELLSMLQQFEDQERNQFLRILDALPQKEEEFIDLLLKTPRRADQRKLIQIFSSISTTKTSISTMEKPEIDLNLPLSQRSKPKLILVVNNEFRQSQQPHQRQKGGEPTPTVNKAA